MHAEGAQAILANTKQDLCLVWNSNLELWGLVIGGHMEYIEPNELKTMDEIEFKTIVTDRMSRYNDSLKGSPDFFYLQ